MFKIMIKVLLIRWINQRLIKVIGHLGQAHPGKKPIKIV